MHTTTFSIADKLELWLPTLFFVLLWAFMQWHGKLPSTKSIGEFTGILNSRGGNIIILSLSSVYFFRYSMYIFLDLLHMVKEKTISEDNAFALMAIQFVTTTAFGGSMGALLKTMTGESTKARSTDNPDNPTPLGTVADRGNTNPPTPPKTTATNGIITGTPAPSGPVVKLP